MNYEEIRPYAHNQWLYFLIGLWPPEESSITLKRVSFVASILLIGITMQTYILLTLELKMQPIMDLMTTYLPTICFATCYYNMLYNIETLKLIKNHIISDFNSLANEQEVIAIKKYVDQNKLYSLVIASIIYCYIGILIVPSLRTIYLYASNNSTELILPIRIEYFLKNINYYIPMLLLQCTGMSVISTVGIAHYTMVIASLQHACALLTVVTVKIDRSLDKNFFNYRSTSHATKLAREFDWIVSVVKYHDSAIDFVNLLTDIYRWSYCIEGFLCILFLILDFFQILQLLDMMMTVNQAIQNCIYILGNILVIYGAFYMSQKLIDHSVNVYAECCQVPFYTLSIKTQKLLGMLIMRSVKPCTINISGMMVTSLKAFAKLANVSYSFAIICYRMR